MGLKALHNGHRRSWSRSCFRSSCFAFGYFSNCSLNFRASISFQLFGFDFFFETSVFIRRCLFVSGPMVYGCLYCARSYQKTLSTLNFAGVFFFSFLFFNLFVSYFLFNCDSYVLFYLFHLMFFYDLAKF